VISNDQRRAFGIVPLRGTIFEDGRLIAQGALIYG